MPISVVGLGAGGHTKGVIEILRLDTRYELIGLLDIRPELHSTYVLGVAVLGSDDLLPTLQAQGVTHFFIGVGSGQNTRPRRRLYEHARGEHLQPVSVTHPRTILSPSSQIGQGATILAGAIINADVQMGENVIINTGAIIEHDCTIASHAHVATGAHLAGTVYIGEGAHIGIGSTIRQGIQVGSNAVVGAGAVVVKNVPDAVIVAGVPARILKRVESI